MSYRNEAIAGTCAAQKESPWTLLESSIKDLARSRAALTYTIDQFCMLPASGETGIDAPVVARSYHRILNESPGEISAEAGEIMNQVNRLRDLLGI